ncbi:MAG: synthase subunit 2 [Paenibacillaceae bacterium]|nr:synthase subunit 2 [Paenibacillaceae bacterium]
MSTDYLKDKLLKELQLKNEIGIAGVNADPAIFENLDLGGKYQEQVHALFEFDHETHVGIEFPTGFLSPSGFRIAYNWDRRSPYKIELENGRYYLTHKGHELFPIDFYERPDYYSQKTTDGTPMKNIATYNQEGAIFVAYSNECALKDKGQDCLFCNINATKDSYAEKEGIGWKNPRQIGEVAKVAYKQGARHITISGGFIPERREVDYYIDVAEAIQEATGLQDFNGTGVIGAPLDLSVINQYKEAGYRTIAMNLEVWDPNMYKVICPGKDAHCGGRDHWIKALEYAAKTFGYGKVRSGFVAGLETKQTTLAGVQAMASIGVIALTGAWTPNPGSALEGHRTPVPEWHWEIAQRSYEIFRKAGFTFDNYYDIAPSPTFLIHDLYRIDDGLLPVFQDKQTQQEGIA